MGYQLSAFFAVETPLRDGAKKWRQAHVVALPQGFGMVPLTSELRAEMGYQTRETAFECCWHLPDLGARWAQKLSFQSPVAYIEIDMFGGTGPRNAILWQRGEIALGPLFETEGGQEYTPPDGATNRVFAALGVQKGDLWDEFDVLGLGRFRHTQGWLELLKTKKQ